ncbi:kinetochore-associated Ndc80 complex subunit nuf2 [Borealophlyctis nickersoniae]|nr:kinetochore-associated Ndc80 complex subunit nuf2 [Borealophlyctis nickersoniae]
MDPYGTRHPPRPKYCFPILSPKDIVQTLSMFNISEDDIAKPTSQRMLHICEQMTEMLMGPPKRQLEFQQLEFLEHPDMHQDAIIFVQFFRKFQKFMWDIGVDDFNMRDVHKPEAPRVRKMLSAAANYFKFREQRFQIMEELAARSDQLLQARCVSEDKKAELAEQLNTLRLQRQEEEPSYRELKVINDALKAALNEIKIESNVITAQLQALSKEKDEIADKFSKADLTLRSVSQEVLVVKSRIVQSPAKLKQSLGDMNATMQTHKATIQADEKTIREYDAKMDMMHLVMQDIAAVIKLMEECETERAKSEEALEKVAADKENIERMKSQHRELEIKQQQLNRQITSANEKLSRLARHESAKNEGLMAKRAKVTEEYEAALEDHKQSEETAKENDGNTILMEEEVANIRRQEAIDAAALDDMIGKLRNKLQLYQTTLDKAMAGV